MSPTYISWHGMKQRCRDPNAAGWKHYGGAAPPVRVCDRWLEPDGRGFLNFLEDLGERPPGTTLGRFMDTGDYEPGRCAWQTVAEQKAEASRKRASQKTGAGSRHTKATHPPPA
jgi:hypothetical protein